MALVSSSDPTITEALAAMTPPVIIDLCGSLGPELEASNGYEGVAW